MPRAAQQKPRDATGRQRRTLPLDRSEGESWLRDATRPASTNPALTNALRPFLDDLTISQRDAVRLLFWEGMTEREAAEHLQITRDSLRDRFKGAKLKLRSALTEMASSESYADVRRWLTPARKIRDDGTEDRWEKVFCSNCYTFVGDYQPNALGFGANVLCPECADGE